MKTSHDARAKIVLVAAKFKDHSGHLIAEKQIAVHRNPEDVVKVIKLSKATYRKMQQNLVWATGYNVFAIPLAAGVLYGVGIVLSPAVGAVLMSASTVVVAINAQLLRRTKLNH